MRVLISISSWVVKHLNLIIVAFISYAISVLFLGHFGYALSGFAVFVFSIILYKHPRSYVYFIIFITPIMGILRTHIPLQVGETYTGFNLGGVFTLWGVVYGTLYFVLKKPRIFEYELTIPILFFTGWMLLSVTYIPQNKLFSLRDWIRTISLLFIYFLILDNFKSSKDAKKLLSFVYYLFVPVFFYFLLSIYFPTLRSGIMRDVQMDLIPGQEVYRLTGFLHANSLGSIVVIYVVLAIFYFYDFQAKHRWIHIVLLVICPILLVSTLSRNSWIAFVLVMPLVGILKYRKMFVIFSLAAIFILLSNPEIIETILLRMQPDPSALGRIKYAKIGLELFSQKPILGWGQGYSHIYMGIRDRSGFQYGVGGADLHNEYITKLVDTGIVGLFTYLFLIYKAFKISFNLFKIPQSITKGYAVVMITVIVTVLINGISGQGFSDLGFYFCIFVGIGEVFLRNFRTQPQLALSISS